MAKLTRKRQLELTGQRFGRGVVLSFYSQKKGDNIWRVQCDCGNEYFVSTDKLRSRHTQSCGCQRFIRDRNLNLIGERFGNGVVVEEVPKKLRRHNGRSWKLFCDCGKYYIARTLNLRNGHTKSCGCLRQFYDGYKHISGTYWRRILYSAAKRGYEVEISIEYANEIFERQNGKCALSGLPIVLLAKKQKGEQTASLDRINSDLGYVKGNLQWVHKKYQRLKTNLPNEEFIEACCQVADWHRNKSSPLDQNLALAA